MKKMSLLVLAVAFAIPTLAQKKENKFCNGKGEGFYFDINVGQKRIEWLDDYYIEKRVGDTTINEVRYTTFTQKYSTGKVEYIFLRKENGKTLQWYAESKNEILRMDQNQPVGYKWKYTATASGHTYESRNEIVSYDASFLTPHCNYSGLLKLKVEYPDIEFAFYHYYLKGFGFVGSEVDGELFGYAVPKWTVTK